jgi:heme exporter protein D
MNWGGWSEFWAMGGYGFYVWGSYAVTVLALGFEILALEKRSRAARKAKI